MKRWKFYALSFTWGLPMTLVGVLTATALRLTGHKPDQYGYCWIFTIGENWGGLNLGPFILTDSTEQSKSHEHGHAIQNCRFGPLMPFLVCIPSVVRYWYRRLLCKTSPEYDAIWFEGQATRVGAELMKNLEGDDKK